MKTSIGIKDHSSEIILCIQVFHLKFSKLCQFTLSDPLFKSIPAKKLMGESIATRSLCTVLMQKWKEVVLEQKNAFYRPKFLGLQLKTS